MIYDLAKQLRARTEGRNIWTESWDHPPHSHFWQIQRSSQNWTSESSPIRLEKQPASRHPSSAVTALLLRNALKSPNKPSDRNLVVIFQEAGSEQAFGCWYHFNTLWGQAFWGRWIICNEFQSHSTPAPTPSSCIYNQISLGDVSYSGTYLFSLALEDLLSLWLLCKFCHPNLFWINYY